MFGVLLLLGVFWSSDLAVEQRPCDGPDVDPWVGELRDRVLTYNGLARVAVERYGVPITCEGAVTTEFDGMRFGFVHLRFREGVRLRVETMPPETSVVLLQAASGFDDAPFVIEALHQYARDVGVAIDWQAPHTSIDGDRRVETYQDPEPGLNASASLRFVEGRLMAVEFGLAI
ncbi:MAG: hypothetical protein OEY20_09145 [Gemmatimonadota bacterium]|nr:hypothetical protein [Gemmatimonadota bacterium]MDH5197405.1 hypothetical protein [Gemmatimonadota bacterium]